MANKIQIKRSVANGVVTGLANGELAYTSNGEVLFIGAPNGNGTSIAIGGLRNPGVLTANQALVANSSSGIDNIIVANLAAGSIWANGSSGGDGNLLYSNGSTIYWAAPAPSVSGSNTYVQFNDSGTSNALSTFTFDKVTQTLYVGNTVDAATFTGTANNSNNLNGKAEANLNVNNASTADTANNSNYLGGKSEADLNVNSASTALNANNASYLNNKSEGDLNVNNAVTSNNSSYLGGNTVGDIVSSAVANTQSNNNTFSGNNIFNGTTITFNSNVSVNGFITSSLIPVNNSYSLGNTTNRWDKIWLVGSTIELGNSAISDTANGVTITNLQVTGNAIIANVIGGTTGISSNLVISSSNIDATSATLRVSDAVVSGNLTINGTLTTVNTNNLVVKDNIIKLALNNTADSLDSGFYVNYNTTHFAGLARDHGDNGVFKLFDTTTEPTTTVDFTTLGTLGAYLKSGALVSNSTAVTLTANATVNVNITANSLVLSTPLEANSGGTGQSSYTAGDLLYASGQYVVGKLGVTSNGEVLQIVNNLPAYGTLDGGSF